MPVRRNSRIAGGICTRSADAPAVSTLVTGERSSVRAAMLGASWGVGHTLSLVIVGASLVVLRAEMPARIADVFELFVAIMLVGLGIRAIALTVRQGAIGPTHTH